MTQNLLMSIKPKYAKKIYSGEKTVELRKTKPKKIHHGSSVFIYETSPAKAITGLFIVDYIYETNFFIESKIIKKASISQQQFARYYNKNDKIVAIHILNYKRINKIPLNKFRERLNINAPQSYRYITEEQAEKFIYWGTEHYKVNN